jgi:hypothetical protein
MTVWMNLQQESRHCKMALKMYIRLQKDARLRHRSTHRRMVFHHRRRRNIRHHHRRSIRLRRHPHRMVFHRHRVVR